MAYRIDQIPFPELVQQSPFNAAMAGARQGQQARIDEYMRYKQEKAARPLLQRILEDNPITKALKLAGEAASTAMWDIGGRKGEYQPMFLDKYEMIDPFTTGTQKGMEALSFALPGESVPLAALGGTLNTLGRENLSDPDLLKKLGTSAIAAGSFQYGLNKAIPFVGNKLATRRVNKLMGQADDYFMGSPNMVNRDPISKTLDYVSETMSGAQRTKAFKALQTVAPDDLKPGIQALLDMGSTPTGKSVIQRGGRQIMTPQGMQSLDDIGRQSKLTQGLLGQGDNAVAGTTGYGFMSPNVRTDLGLDEAIAALNTNAHKQLRQTVDQFDNSFTLKPSKTYDAIGAWKDGAENAFYQEFDNIANFDDLKYSLATKGRMLNQKGVIPFMKQVDGGDMVHVFNLDSGDVRTIADDLTRVGVEFKTIAKTPQGSKVIVFNPGSDNGIISSLNKFSAKYGKTPETIRGVGEFIGADTREAAAQVYDDIINAYTPRSTPITSGVDDLTTQAGRLRNIPVKQPQGKVAQVARDLRKYAMRQATGMKGMPPKELGGAKLLDALIDDPIYAGAKSLDDLGNNAAAVLNKNEGIITAKAREFAEQGATVDLTPIIKDLDDKIASAHLESNKQVLKQVRNDIFGGIADPKTVRPDIALDIRREIGGKTNWSPFMSVDEKSALGAYKSTYGKTNDILDELFRGLGFKDFRSINKEVSLASKVKNLVKVQAGKAGGQAPVGLYDVISGGAGFMMTGNPVHALMAVGGQRALRSPQASRLAANLLEKGASLPIPSLPTNIPVGQVGSQLKRISPVLFSQMYGNLGNPDEVVNEVGEDATMVYEDLMQKVSGGEYDDGGMQLEDIDYSELGDAEVATYEDLMAKISNY